MLSLAALLVIATAAVSPAFSRPAQSTVADLVIPDAYIVVLNNGVSLTSHFSKIASLISKDSYVKYRYEIGEFKGYSIHTSPAIITQLKRHADVKYVDNDSFAHISGDQVNPPSWGLDRSDQRDRPLNQLYSYSDTAGVNSDAYIIDTGIRAHNDYTGRWVWGANFVNDGIADDCNGHGTHVAGTTGGTAYGIAKLTNLIAVKVLGCSGSGAWSGVIAGLDWVTDQHLGSTERKSVGNMSLGGGLTPSVNEAVDASSAQGVIHVVAAGNNNADACNFSPASAPTAISIGATDINDNKASFSNHGSRCVHLHAPGVNIVSTYYTCATCTATLSGTSMAAPHVCGAVALQLTDNGTTSPADMRNQLVAGGSTGRISGLPAGTPNVLLYTLY
jgi:subtilisin family serine protease